MLDQPNEKPILESFQGGLNLSSLDIMKPSAEPTLRSLPALSEQLQPQPSLRSLPTLSRTLEPQPTLGSPPALSEQIQLQPQPTLRRLPTASESTTNQQEIPPSRPEVQPPKPLIEDADVPRPHRNKQSAWQELSSKVIEMPSALASGYFMANRAGENVAKANGLKVKTLSDVAIPNELATDFNTTREHLSAKLKSRLKEATAVVESTLEADPSLNERGYAFQFKKAQLSDKLWNQLHRPGNLEEVLTAIDKVPRYVSLDQLEKLQQGKVPESAVLTPEKLQQASEYFEHLGKSPLLQEEDMTKWTTELNESARKFREALAVSAPTDLTESGRATQAAEKEFYDSVLNLRHNVGLKKHAADLDLQELMKTEPDLFLEGKRFEFAPEITPEKLAELKRPDELRELLSKVELTHNPEAEKLITSQGEHLENLRGLSKNAVIQREGLAEVATSLENSATKVIKSRSTAFNSMLTDQPRVVKTALLTLGAGVGANWAVDRLFFNGQNTGMTTHAANIFAPAILISDFNPKIKFGVIAGSHLLARISEIPKYKHLERTKTDLRPD